MARKRKESRLSRELEAAERAGKDPRKVLLRHVRKLHEKLTLELSTNRVANERFVREGVAPRDLGRLVVEEARVREWVALAEQCVREQWGLDRLPSCPGHEGDE
jgi:hypothetical protein